MRNLSFHFLHHSPRLVNLQIVVLSVRLCRLTQESQASGRLESIPVHFFLLSKQQVLQAYYISTTSDNSMCILKTIDMKEEKEEKEDNKLEKKKKKKQSAELHTIRIDIYLSNPLWEL